MRKTYRNAVISFLCTMLSLVVIFTVIILSNDNVTLLVGDAFQQYITFITSFINDIGQSGSIWYSFSNYLGSGNILTVAYYCLSPFNIIFFLLGDNFSLAFAIIIILKISVASATFYFFISYFKRKNTFFYIIASVFYSLSGCVVAWYFNIMWLEAVYMLPIIIMLIIRFVDKGKYLWLVFAYSYLFITNFYMAYIVGIYSAVFFVMYTLHINEYKLKSKLLTYLKIGGAFAGVVLLATGICSFVLLSVAGFMSAHMATDNASFEALTASFLDFVNSMFIGEFQTMDNEVPILYCGIPTCAIAFYYFICKRVETKDKAFYGIQLMMYVISMGFLPAYIFLHAFDYPNFYAFRFSIIIVFILVTVSCSAYEYLEEKSFSFFKRFMIVALILYSFMMTFQIINYNGNRLNDQSGLLINFVFLLLWLLLFWQKYVVKKHIKKVMVLILVSAELVTNGYMCIVCSDFNLIDKQLVNEWYYAEKDVINEIKNADDDFYRVYINNEANINSGKMFGYNTLNTFSSADNFDLRMALSKLGESSSNRYLRANCMIPVFDSLFAVKYYVQMPEYDEYSEMIIDEDNFIKATVERNEFALSLGYMVDRDILSYSFSDNAFDNVERLCNAMSGEDKDIFEDVLIDREDVLLDNYQMSDSGERMYFTRISDYAEDSSVIFTTVDYDRDMYIELHYNKPSSYIQFPEVVTSENSVYCVKSVGEGGVYKMDTIGGGSFASIYSPGTPARDFFINSVNMAKYNKDEFYDIYEELASNQYMIYENLGDYISGKIIATSEKPILFTSIPYDPEWHVYVDGKPVGTLYRVVGDAFMAIELTPGEHIVTFQYIEKWSNEGAIISLLSVSVFCILVMFCILKKRKNIAVSEVDCENGSK